jgi:hypothetical protein
MIHLALTIASALFLGLLALMALGIIENLISRAREESRLAAEWRAANPELVHAQRAADSRYVRIWIVLGGAMILVAALWKT